MRKLSFLFIFCFAALFAEPEVSFKERLKKSHRGDYIVTEANKMITILAIRSQNGTSLVLEEITAPVQNLKKRPPSWSEWVKNRAPGHTSWSMVEIDLSDNQLLECYSFSRAAWLQATSQDSIISTLLHLPLKTLPADQQRKIGPAPMPGEPDTRKIWKPSLTVEGQKVEKADFEVYATEWPKDSSELAGKTVVLYFDKEGRFPLPYWIQVEAAHGTASMRVIDSGKNLPSPYNSLPRRVPEFVGNPQLTEQGLRLHLKSPKYYKKFELFAIDVTTKEKHIFPILHSMLSGQGEILNLEIAKEELELVLKPGHKYTWLLVPTGYSEFYTESAKPFHWNPN
ncbi:MAG: hypothetical protein JSS32_10710 [Verrucomicrobia bacterium]|nr:hypothetical protein [Verrucomicrobiota bacterium]